MCTAASILANVGRCAAPPPAPPPAAAAAAAAADAAAGAPAPAVAATACAAAGAFRAESAPDWKEDCRPRPLSAVLRICRRHSLVN